MLIVKIGLLKVSFLCTEHVIEKEMDNHMPTQGISKANLRSKLQNLTVEIRKENLNIVYN